MVFVADHNMDESSFLSLIAMDVYQIFDVDDYCNQIDLNDHQDNCNQTADDNMSEKIEKNEVDDSDYSKTGDEFDGKADGQTVDETDSKIDYTDLVVYFAVNGRKMIRIWLF